MKKALTVILPLILCLPGLAVADGQGTTCKVDSLKGRYVFQATGFQRLPDSQPGTPWVPKGLLDVFQFNGDGTLTTPLVIVANPPGDFGNVFSPPLGGAPGEYSINADCTGTVHFFDPFNVMFKIYVDPSKGDTIWMLQINPNNNVFQGKAERVSR